MGKSATITSLLATAGICMAMPTGCGVFDAGQDDTDATTYSDTATARDSSTFLEDVTLLLDEGGRTDSAAADQGVYIDIHAADGESVGGDDGRDVVEGQDAQAPDYGIGEDVIVSADAATDTALPAEIRMPCTDADTHSDCPDGFTCESIAKGGFYCRPPQECSLDGLTGLPELVTALISDGGQVPVFVKLVVEVEMGPPTCSMEQCLPRECCRTCSASLHVADSAMPIIIRGTDSQNTIGCTGHDSSDQTQCDAIECGPLVPAEKYVIWGSIRMFNPWELAVDGFCPMSEAQPAVD